MNISRNKKREIEIAQLMIIQNSKCGICFKPFDPERNNLKHLDHCHATGKVRGLLCNKCNVSLGHMEDSIERLEMCIKYILWWKEEHAINGEKDYKHELAKLLEMDSTFKIDKRKK